jgi:hypothetical protein
VSRRPDPHTHTPQPHTATILDERDEEHRRVLEQLRADPRIEFADTLAQQRATLARLQPAVPAELSEEPHRWAYYPWRRTVVGILGPMSFAALRLDRNRNMITAAEQARLGQLRVGVVGLSVGHVIAHTLALQGVVGHLRLADFDELELSNLNRVPATVLDLGLNKAVIAARRIAEVSPYLRVDALTAGLTADTLDDFFDGLDVVVDECDSLDMKVAVRESARARRLPVLMSTGDRGLIDVERFDHEPQRPILHGLLRGIDSSQLAGLSTRDKIPHMLRFLEVSRSSARAAASMVEVGSTLTTWPQLAGEVVLGATSVVEAVRRIGLGEPMASGRVRIDIAAALDQVSQPQLPAEPEPHDAPVPRVDGDVSHTVALAASRAPSAGNAQPWRISVGDNQVTVSVDPLRTSILDICHRASAVAVGAAAFNATVAAAAQNALGEVTVSESDADSPLTTTIRLGTGTDRDLAGLMRPMLARRTTREHGTTSPIGEERLAAITTAARARGAEFHVLTERRDIDSIADILAAADRIRYLTPHLHAEMLDEVRWQCDPDPADDRIDVGSLALDDDDLAALDILRRSDVMSYLSAWAAGTSLGDSTRDRIRASSALGLVTVQGHTLADYARGGSAMEASWITANDRSVAVHPVSPLFLYALDDADLTVISPEFAPELRMLQRDFREVAKLRVDETAVLLLRLTSAAIEPGPPSRRRELVTEQRDGR